MAVTGNIVSEIGDVLFISPNIPVVGLSSISGFVDTILGTTGTRFFNKEFRYSLDGGINWTEYLALTAPNLAAVPTNPKFDFKIQYRYTRAGVDTTGVLVLEGVDINGVYNIPLNGLTFDNSVFHYFFSTPHNLEILEWSLSVLEKLYLPGILPKAITRGENRNANEEDRDFIDFWRTLTTFFGTIVVYARQFELIDSNRDLLMKFLRGRDMFVCSNQSLFDLTYLKKNFYDEMRHRGTAMIAVKKNTLLYGTTTKPVDGELLRLICYNSLCDEFLFGVSEFGTVSWVVNQWSPLWQGISNQHQFTKIYEPFVYPVDITKYPGINALQIANDPAISRNVLRMKIIAPGAVSGIGTTTDFSFATNVSPKIPYELSFYVRRTPGNPSPLTVRLRGYNAANVQVDLFDVSNPAFPVEDTFINAQTINDNGVYYFVQCILYPHDHVYDSSPEIITPNIGFGVNLKSNPNICKVIPEVLLDNTAEATLSDTLYIYNFKFAPLSTPYSTGFIGLANYIQMWTHNNNGMLSQSQLDKKIRRKLVPYKSILQNNPLQ